MARCSMGPKSLATSRLRWTWSLGVSAAVRNSAAKWRFALGRTPTCLGQMASGFEELHNERGLQTIWVRSLGVRWSELLGGLHVEQVC